MEILFLSLVFAYFLCFYFYPRLSLISLPLFFPLYLWRFDLFNVPTNFIEVLILIAFALWLFKVFALKQRDLLEESFLKEWFVPLTVMILGAFVGLLTAKSQGVLYLPSSNVDFDSYRVALGVFKSWIIIPILYFVLFKNLLHDSWYKKLTLNAYLASALVLSLWALWQMFSGQFITIDGRASGPFESANYLGLYIAPAVLASILLIWQSILKRNISDLRKFSFLFFVLFVALIGSRSYGAFMGVLAGLAFYFIFGLRSWKKTLVAFLSIVLLLSIFLFSQKDTEKFQVLFELDQRSSSSVRVQTWQIALNLISQNPIVGIGLNQFQAQYELKAETVLGKQPFELTQLHPHNIVLSFWLNMGILGVLFFIMLVVKLAKKIFQEDKSENLIYLSLFIVVLVHGLVDQPFWKNDLSLLFWMIVALI